jgi:hypothetical protein
LHGSCEEAFNLTSSEEEEALGDIIINAEAVAFFFGDGGKDKHFHVAE